MFRDATWLKVSANREQISCSVLLTVMPFGFSPVILVLSLDRCFGSIVTVAAESQASPSKAPRRMSAGLRERREEEEEEDGKQKGEMTIPNTSVTDVTEPLSSKTITPPPSPATAPTCKEKAELEKRIVEERVEEKVEERKGDVNEQPRKKPFWLEDEDLPPMM